MKILRAIPWQVYAAGAGISALVTLWAGVASYGASRYADGRRSVTASAEAITPAVIVVRGADSTAKAATDTIVKRIVETRWKIDTLILRVPDSLKAVPEIKALVGSVALLTARIDTLTRTMNVERAVSRLRASTDSAALVTARVVIVQKEDQIVQLKKRPQWRTVGLIAGAAFVAGMLR